MGTVTHFFRLGVLYPGGAIGYPVYGEASNSRMGRRRPVSAASLTFVIQVIRLFHPPVLLSRRHAAHAFSGCDDALDAGGILRPLHGQIMTGMSADGVQGMPA